MSRPLPLRLTDAAEADLAEIWATLASDASEHIATDFVAAIESAFEPLRHFPLSGPARELLARGLRVTFHSPYAIYYMPLADAVVIVRIIHGARDIAALAERGAVRMTHNKVPAAKTRKRRIFDTWLVAACGKFTGLPAETLHSFIDEAITATRQAADHSPSIAAKLRAAAAALP